MDAILDKNTVFFYITIFLIILYIFTVVINTNIGHLLTFFLVLLFLFFNINFSQKTQDNFYNDMVYKINNLSKDNSIKKYIYLDPDIIVLFDEIKYDFYEYNPDAYYKALSAANNILWARKMIEVNLCPQPIVPNLLNNFGEINLKDSTEKCNKITRHSYQLFILAKEQYRLCINYLHSFILSLPSTPAVHLKHLQMMDRSRLILKRNLDIIKNIYKKNTDLKNTQINDYDTFIPANEQTGELFSNEKNLENSFYFF